MDPWEVSLCIVCLQHHDAHQASTVKRLQRQSAKGIVPMPVPTIDVGNI